MIKDNLGKKKIIFSDIFDTILYRRVYPEYIKKIWSKEINTIFNLGSSSEDLYKKRFDYEAQLCQSNNQNGYDLEFRYSDLIKKLYESLKPQIDFDRFLEICKKTEVDIESRNSYLNDEIYQELKELTESACSLYLVSDMYLEEDMIKEILSRIGFDVNYNGIFVSSSYLITKRSGKLYSVILDELNILPEAVMMMGDNQYSDYDEAIRNGLTAYLVDATAQKEKYAKHGSFVEKMNYEKELKTILNKNKGFENIVGSLYLFTRNLYQQLLKDEVKDVFFLAREGEFLIKIFSEYQKYIGDSSIKAHYFLASRKSTFLPSLNQLENEDFFNLFRQYIHISVFEFLTSINFNDEEISIIRNEMDFNIDERVNDLPRSTEFSTLLTNDKFRNIYEENRVEQNANFKAYVNQFGVNESEGLNFVDVGWKGTIQDNILNIYDKEIKVKGYYLGLVATGNMSEINTKEGLLFSLIDNTDNSVIYNENRALFEMLLDASHGSANRYQNVDGKINVKVFEDDNELKLFNDKIKPIQDRIFEDFCRISELLVNSDYDGLKVEKIFNRYHAEMVFKPNKFQLSFFENIFHLENFGVCEISSFEVNKNRSLRNKINEYIKLISNPRKYLGSSFWIFYTFYQNDLQLARIIYGRSKWSAAKNKNLFRTEG